VCSVDVGSIGRTTYKLLSGDCVRVASQDPEEELVASNLLTALYVVLMELRMDWQKKHFGATAIKYGWRKTHLVFLKL
jgi:hypothetical protein